jgi:hypothetical protein
MVILNYCDIRLLILILKLILALFRFFFLLVLFVLILSAFFILLLLFLQLCLLFELINSFSLSNLIVSDNSFPHLIIVGVHEFTQYLLLFLVFSFELFIQHFNLANLGAQLYVIGLECRLLRA